MTEDNLNIDHLDSENEHINFNNYFFVGIGGIGMSALARYFNAQGCQVVGYDKTPTQLTNQLSAEGISIHFEDNLDLIPKNFNKDNTQVVFTPAIPKDHKQLNFFVSNGFSVKKRSEILGDITEDSLTVAVAGTHGKTTTSTMVTHILHYAKEPVTAFLGGISTNLNSNLIIADEEFEQIVVVEADEYDRSFLRLHPDISVITSVDADHLDIYGDASEMEKSFVEFSKKLPDDGSLIVNAKFAHLFNTDFTYGLNEGDYFAINRRIQDGRVVFDAQTPKGIIKNIVLNQPGTHNIENALAAIAVAQQLDIKNKLIGESFESYLGVKRRFEYIIKSEKITFIDDYAHHPTEINSFLSSVRELYPNKKITAIFQPHLFTRTRDFAEGFSSSLSLADEVILCPIYPARELPIEGVNSEMLLKNITVKKEICEKSKLVELLKTKDLEVIVTIGAGDIDKEVEPIKQFLLTK